MAPLDQWLSPQLQQAVVTGLFVAIGWIVVASQTRRRDATLRRARETDLQRALLAEIRAHVFALEQQVPSPQDAALLVSRTAAWKASPRRSAGTDPPYPGRSASTPGRTRAAGTDW